MRSGPNPFDILRRTGARPRPLQFVGMGDSIALGNGTEAVAAALDSILPHWPRCQVIEGAPRIEVDLQDGEHRIASPWLETPQWAATPASAACALIIEMARSWLHARPGMLCLHCAAIERHGRLIVIAGTNRSGKSTLAAALGEAGATVICDDMLPLTEDGDGVALGVPPRIRLPLPDSLKTGLVGRAAERLVAADERYGYTMPRAMAPHGTSLPLGGIILLDRIEAGETSFHAVDRGEALAQLLLRNLHRDIDAGNTLDRLLKLADRLPVARLRYADIEDAVGRLMTLDPDNWPETLPPLAENWAQDTGSSLLDRQTMLTQANGVATRDVDGEIFAIDPRTEELFRLNAVAAIVWDILAEPVSVAEIADIIVEAFPHARPEQVEADIGSLVSALLERGLICMA